MPVTGVAGFALATPGPRTLQTALCSTAAPGDSLGALVGVVRDADTDEPVGGATVTITWTELAITRTAIGTERRRVPVRAQASGVYAVCGLPTDGPLLASADAPGHASGLVEVAILPGGLTVQEFAVADSAAAPFVVADSGTAGTASAGTPAARVARGTARLTGTVRGRNGAPVRGAQLLVWGTGLTARTREDGTFTLAGLPAGTHTVEARAVGLEPRRTAVALASGRTATVALAMTEAVRTLDVVTVRGRRSRSTRALERFAERQRNGFGRFVTASDIERRNPLQTTDALRMVPGLQFAPARGTGYRLRARGGCKPALILDGMPIMDGADDLDMLVRPQDVLGIEVYTGIGGIPAEWTGLQAGGCGVVAVWTKR